MGADLSKLAAGSGKGDKPKTILCPPLFERDLKARSRLSKSSYDYLFAKPALRWLLTDYFDGGVNSTLFFAPPLDPRISIKAKIGNPGVALFGDSRGVGNASSSSSSPAGGGYGNMSIRYQPLGPNEPSTFIDVKASPAVGQVGVRACFFDASSGLGVFAAAPLSSSTGGGGTSSQRRLPELGVRYSTPNFTAGSVVRPGTGEVSGAWVAGRWGDVTAGLQLRPCAAPSAAFSRAPLALLGGGQGKAPSSSPADVSRWLRERTSVAVAYSPRGGGVAGAADGAPSSSTTTAAEARTRAGQPVFSAALELIEGRAFAISFYQHMAAVRRVFNPFEGSSVVGITNYVDVGLRLVMPLSPEGSADPLDEAASASPSAGTLELGAAWQPNKNTYLKAKLTSTSVALMTACKSWYNPSLALAACVEWRFSGGGLRFGVHGQAENYGALRYERPREASASVHGAQLTQRHEATSAERAMAAREKPLVPGDEAFGARNVEPASQLYM